jgi:hypothetical protein
MRALQSRTSALERQRAIDAIDASIAALFRRCPELSGFSVQDAKTLRVVEVARDAGYGDVDELREEVVEALFELLDERPEAHELLRGRTFARTLH